MCFLPSKYPQPLTLTQPASAGSLLLLSLLCWVEGSQSWQERSQLQEKKQEGMRVLGLPGGQLNPMGSASWDLLLGIEQVSADVSGAGTPCLPYLVPAEGCTELTEICVPTRSLPSLIPSQSHHKELSCNLLSWWMMQGAAP